eukprot:g2844.t1
MRRQPSGVAAQGIFRLPVDESAGAGGGFAVPASAGGGNGKRGSHLLSYSEFQENNNDEYLTLFDGEGTSGADGSTRPCRGGYEAALEPGESSAAGSCGFEKASTGRRRAGTATARDAAGGSRTDSHTPAADNRASGLHLSAVSPSRHRKRNKTGSPFPATPGGVSSERGSSNDGGASMANWTDTRASSQNIKKILQQEKITDCEPGIVKSVRTSSDAQKYGSPRSGRSGLLKSSSNGSFDVLPRSSSSSDRLNMMYMNNFNGSNLALSSSMFARSNSGLDLFNLYRSNSNQSILPMDPQSTAGGFQNITAATSGNGSLVIELSPEASEKANVKTRMRKRKSQDAGLGGLRDLDSSDPNDGRSSTNMSHNNSENGQKANAYSKSARRTVQPSKVVFENPFLNSLNLMNDMQVIGGDPKRTSTSPAWRQLKHNSKILTALGVAELFNCNPTTQSISARLPFGGIIHIPLRTLLSSMLRFNYAALTFSNEHLKNSSVRQIAIENAQNKLEKNFKQREQVIAANTAMSKNSASTKTNNGSRKRAKPSKLPAAKKETDGRGLSASTVAPSLPIRITKKVNRGKTRKHKKELICDECKKTFRLQHNLRAHKRTHTGEQPFQCKFPGCGKRFNHGGNLLKHERRHIPYEQRPYPCDVPGCGKRFMEACDLRTHKKGHSMKRSSYRGVTIERGRWKAQIGYGGKTHHIGTFDTDVDAARAYDSEALRVHGKKALLNFPRKGQAGQIGTRKAPPRGKANLRQGRNYGKLLSVKSAPKSE